MNNEKIYKDIILEEDEEIIKIVRQSILSLILSLTIPVVLVVMAFLLFFLLFSLGLFGTITFVLMVVIGLMLAIKSIKIWYFKVLIITNQKIVDVDQAGIFKKTVSSVPLTEIKEVFYETAGLGQTLFGSGNLKINLKDGKTRIEVNQVPQPQKLQQLINFKKSELAKPNQLESEISKSELISLIKTIKAEIGEEQFNNILNKSVKK